jgi:AcrR family transcriptional regulator
VLNSRKLGRRAGANRSRSAILKAARASFAAHGYDGATFRDVARRAGVHFSLVSHFYGTKAQLFEASLELPVDPAELQTVLRGPLKSLGRRIATFYFKRVFHRRAQTVHSLLRSCVSNAEAAAILRRLIETSVVAMIERAFPGPETALRAELVACHMMGLFLGRYILGVSPIAHTSDDRLIELVAPVLQRYLVRP